MMEHKHLRDQEDPENSLPGFGFQGSQRKSFCRRNIIPAIIFLGLFVTVIVLGALLGAERKNAKNQVAPASHAAPQLTCVRSLKCNISRYQGCYMVEGMCHCAQAFCCNNPFTYSSLKNCLANNTDQFEDPCEENPCKNNGYCVQLSKKGSKKIGFRCECHGTGYYGPRCYEKCPEDLRKEISKYLDSKAKFALRRLRNLLACRGV